MLFVATNIFELSIKFDLLIIHNCYSVQPFFEIFLSSIPQLKALFVFLLLILVPLNHVLISLNAFLNFWMNLTF